jgi:hypothetical protein
MKNTDIKTFYQVTDEGLEAFRVRITRAGYGILVDNRPDPKHKLFKDEVAALATTSREAVLKQIRQTSGAVKLLTSRAKSATRALAKARKLLKTV